jgi:hypothetical protein
MFRKHAARIGLVLISLAALCSTTMAARRNTTDVLVVPSRYTIVQLSFDIVALRDVALVAYGNSATSGDLLLHAWDADTGTWKSITADEYAVGAFSSREPDEMILIGSDADLPSAIIAGASQARNVTRIDTLSVVTVVNALHKRMKFTEREWKLLAERHGLEIKDSNYERRRWGRYGPPGKKTKAPESVELPAEDIASEPEETVETESLEPASLGPVEEKGMPEVEPAEVEAPEAKTIVKPEAAESTVAAEVEAEAPDAAIQAEDAVIDSVVEPSPADK